MPLEDEVLPDMQALCIHVHGSVQHCANSGSPRCLTALLTGSALVTELLTRVLSQDKYHPNAATLLLLPVNGTAPCCGGRA